MVYYYRRGVYKNSCNICPDIPQPILSNSSFLNNTISERKRQGGTLRYHQEHGHKQFLILSTGRNRLGGAFGSPGGTRKPPRNFA